MNIWQGLQFRCMDKLRRRCLSGTFSQFGLSQAYVKQRGNVFTQAIALPSLDHVAKLLDENPSYAFLTWLLKRCSETQALSAGRLVHVYLTKHPQKRNLFLGNWLVKMYGDCGSINDARGVFDTLPSHNLRSWNILIKAYAKNGYGRKALESFREMQQQGVKPNHVTFVSVLDACSSLEDLHAGQETHRLIVQNGYEKEVIVGTALVSMYGKCSRPDVAKGVFNNMPHRDRVSWNAIISACSLSGNATDALDLFDQMQVSGISPNESTFVSVLDACTVQNCLEKGKQIHGMITAKGFEQHVVVATALMNMYAKCGSLEEAREVFKKMTYRNVISWNAMISACTHNDHAQEALYWYDQMKLQGLKPNQITFVCVLDACANLAALERGRQIHAAIKEAGGEDHDPSNDGHVVVGTALVNMYSKCGRVKEARSVFDRMRCRNLISWNAMILGCAQNGEGKEALDLFKEMRDQGTKPDAITFLAVLAACSHTSQVDKARIFFNTMRKDYGIDHKEDHYVCMVDILGRSGLLGEAEQMISTMPFESAAVWLCLLSACRVHADMDRGVRAANQVIKLDPENPAPYALLSNILAGAGRWDDARDSRYLLKSSGYIEVNK